MTKTLFFILGFFVAAGLLAWMQRPHYQTGPDRIVWSESTNDAMYHTVTLDNGTVRAVMGRYADDTTSTLYIDSDDKGTPIMICKKDACTIPLISTE